MYIHKSIDYGIKIRGEKANNTQTYTMTYKKINEHTQITYITINLTYSDFITGNSSVYVRNGIKVNTQKYI